MGWDYLGYRAGVLRRRLERHVGEPRGGRKGPEDFMQGAALGILLLLVIGGGYITGGGGVFFIILYQEVDKWTVPCFFFYV